MDLNFSPLSLIIIIESIAPWPTFLTARSPNLMDSCTTVKFAKLSFMSGGSIFIPILMDSLIYAAILSRLSFSLVRSAVINSTGKFAFRYAVL